MSTPNSPSPTLEAGALAAYKAHRASRLHGPTLPFGTHNITAALATNFTPFELARPPHRAMLECYLPPSFFTTHLTKRPGNKLVAVLPPNSCDAAGLNEVFTWMADARYMYATHRPLAVPTSNLARAISVERALRALGFVADADRFRASIEARHFRRGAPLAAGDVARIWSAVPYGSYWVTKAAAAVVYMLDRRRRYGSNAFAEVRRLVDAERAVEAVIEKVYPSVVERVICGDDGVETWLFEKVEDVALVEAHAVPLSLEHSPYQAEVVGGQGGDGRFPTVDREGRGPLRFELCGNRYVQSGMKLEDRLQLGVVGTWRGEKTVFAENWLKDREVDGD